MDTIVGKFCLSLLASIVLIAGSAIAAPNPALDGKTFKGEVKIGSEKSDPDNFVFDKGTFRSTACDEYGFTASPYNTTAVNGKTAFQVTTKNKDGWTIAWNGTLSNNTIEGTAIRTNGEGKVEHGTFKGTATH